MKDYQKDAVEKLDDSDDEDDDDDSVEYSAQWGILDDDDEDDDDPYEINRLVRMADRGAVVDCIT